MDIKNIKLESLQSHPLNRRVEGLDTEHVTDIASSIASSGFNPTKALTVRAVNDSHYEIVEGHHRAEAAKQAGIDEVPCYVEDLDDEQALVKLINGNRQRGNNPFDIGLAAIELKKSGLSYAKIAPQLGVHVNSLKEFVAASEVFEKNAGRPATKETAGRPAIPESHTHYYEISKAPEQYWKPLVTALNEEALSVNLVKGRVKKILALKEACPKWHKIQKSLYPEICGKTSFCESLTNSLARAAEIHSSLETHTLYQHIDSGAIEEQGGREYHIMTAEPYEYDAKAAFVTEMNGLESITLKLIAETESNVLRVVTEGLDSQDRLEPVLSEEEERARAEEAERERARQERAYYLPKMIHGDAESELAGIGESEVDLVLIDPPYNMDKADWDSFGSGKDFADWCDLWLPEVMRVLRPSGSLYMFGINRMLSHVQHRLDSLGMKYRNWITWDTIQGAGGGLWVNRHEAILYYSKTDEPFEDSEAVKLERHEENVREYKGKEYRFKNPSNVWRFPCVDDKSHDRTEHPTQKPVELIERIVKASCPEDGMVLDCFMGSGTTGVAAMKNKRRSIGIEKSADYIKTANARFDTTEVA